MPVPSTSSRGPLHAAHPSSRRPILWRRFSAVAQPSTAAPTKPEAALPTTQLKNPQQLLATAARPESPPPPAAAAAAAPSPSPSDQPTRFSSLYNWLRFGGLPTAQPAVSQGPQPEEEEVVAASLGDGMAAGPLLLSTSTSTTTRRSSSRAGILSLRRSPAPVPAAPGPQIDTSHATLQLLRQRLADGSKPGCRKDAFKLGLVVEGGGMRGCVSAGALQALSDLGWRDVFDCIYGSSAGAINSTYFLSGQREGVDIYHQHIAHSEFIDLKRLWRGEPGAPVLNLDYLIDYVMHHVKPLDWDAVLGSDVPLKVVASSLDALQPVLLEDFACKDDLATSLRASANVPEIAGPYVVHRGQRLVDAAVFEPVPFRSAIADGCTHLLVLCTRPKKERKGYLPPLEGAIERAIKKAVLSPSYMVPAWKAEMEYLAKDGLSQDDMLMRSFDEDAHELPWFAGSHVYPLYPGPAASFSPLCTDVPTLRAGVAEGRRGVMALAQSLLRDVLDSAAGPREDAHESNIMPITLERLGGRGGGKVSSVASGGRLARLWRR